jgi:hypothetical protein
MSIIINQEKKQFGKNAFDKKRAENKQNAISRANFEKTFWVKPYKVIVGFDSFGWFYQVIKI